MQFARFAVVFILVFLSAATPRGLAFTRQPVTADHGMVVTSQHLASDVGVAIMRQGGNAADAAVAVGYALAVVNPCCGNIGGGGFATLHLADGRDVFLNFREKAPLASTEKMFLDENGEVVKDLSLKGYLAVAIPGTVLGLDTLLQKYGTLPRAVVMAPAIRLAEEGFILGQGDADILAASAAALAAQPNVASVFLKAGKPWLAGDRLVQTNLAATLKQIAAEGPDAFYKGSIADRIVAASSGNGGILTKQDFTAYSVIEDKPVRCNYRDYELISAPPPSSGGTAICEILNILEGYPLAQFGFNSSRAVHVMAEAMRHAFVDRVTTAPSSASAGSNSSMAVISFDFSSQVRCPSVSPYSAA